MPNGLRYINDMNGSRIVDENGDTVVEIPDSSALFNPDDSWNLRTVKDVSDVFLSFLRRADSSHRT